MLEIDKKYRDPGSPDTFVCKGVDGKFCWMFCLEDKRHYSLRTDTQWIPVEPPKLPSERIDEIYYALNVKEGTWETNKLKAIVKYLDELHIKSGGGK